jgi:amino acid transporter
VRIDLKRVIVGRPLPADDHEAQRLTKAAGLAVFGPDAVSNTAFGAETLLRVLVPVAAMAALSYVVPLTVAILVMLAFLGLSYAQMINAYPRGGGTYAVCGRQMGSLAAEVAGSALLVDYTLTVTVSVAVATRTTTSAVTGLRGRETLICVGLIWILAVINLRGIRESKRVAMVPAYTYVAVVAGLVVWGLLRSASGGLGRLPVDQAQLRAATDGGRLVTGVTAVYVLRAFAAGTVALSGVEAISNGVPTFEQPRRRNARITLAWTLGLLGSTLLGVAILTARLRPTLSTTETVLSTLGAAVFGRNSMLYILLQAATMLILLFAANTGFSDFPRITAVIAGDGRLPRPLADRGERQVFSKAILLAAGLSSGLVLGFGSDVEVLASLWAVALLLTFTMSQLGMAAHHVRERKRGWRVSIAVNALGATATTLSLGVLMVTTFGDGAWLLAIAVPTLVLTFRAFARHSRKPDDNLTTAR